jgi:hypothetical protein
VNSCHKVRKKSAKEGSKKMDKLKEHGKKKTHLNRLEGFSSIFEKALKNGFYEKSSLPGIVPVFWIDPPF